MAKIDKKSLVEFFRVESEEHFEIILDSLQTLNSDHENWSLIDEIFRSTHTIKGSAAMVDFENISKVAHRFENIFEKFRIGAKKIDQRLVGRIINIVEDFANITKNSDDDIPEDVKLEFFSRIDELENISEEPISDKVDENRSGDEPVDKNLHYSREDILKKADEHFDKVYNTERPEHFVHIKLFQVNKIVDMLGELIVSKNRDDAMVKSLLIKFSDLSYATERLDKVIKDVEDRFSYSDMLELGDDIPKQSDVTDDFSLAEFDRYDTFNIYSRQLSEIANDIKLAYKSIEEQLDNYGDEVSSANRLIDKLRKDITSVRMVPVDKLFSTAIRAAKTTAVIEGKDVEVRYSGEKLSIDNTVFDALKESFIHLVRNSVSHGIEKPDDRSRLNKKSAGLLILRAQRQGSQIIFEIEDDGAGIDLEKVRQKAVDKNIINRYEADNMRSDKLIELLFMPGFTTKDSVDDVSGRGVGLDVVKESVEKVGGEVKISSDLGKGTRITLTIPVKEVIGDYLLIAENGQLFSIPLLNISSIFYLDKDKLQKRSSGYKYDLRGDMLDIYDLGVILKQVNIGEFDDTKSCIVLNARNKRYIISVDKILDRTTTVTKLLPQSLKSFTCYSGATLGIYGNIALILDPLNLVKSTESYSMSVNVKDKDESVEAIKYLPNSILIVDDSLSVRRYLGKLLDNYGFNYFEAKNGLDGLAILRERKFDLIITDLEMPLMNGYELINSIRGELFDHETPIFVLTSRGTDKHRNKAIELGADDFIMKPFDEDEIIEKIKEAISGRSCISKQR
ncbi:MAG: response regulator [Calditerrivibrio sp.]|nr:response regulator [Calditerrivibrio sp.]